MAHYFLIFDFETNEEAAQQARHKVEGWTQGFRLGKKMLLKFEREEASELKEAGNSGAKAASNKKKSATKEIQPKAPGACAFYPAGFFGA